MSSRVQRSARPLLDQQAGGVAVPQPGFHADATGQERIGQVEGSCFVDVDRGEVGEDVPAGDRVQPVRGIGQEPGAGGHPDGHVDDGAHRRHRRADGRAVEALGAVVAPRVHVDGGRSRRDHVGRSRGQFGRGARHRGVVLDPTGAVEAGLDEHGGPHTSEKGSRSRMACSERVIMAVNMRSDDGFGSLA